MKKQIAARWQNFRPVVVVWIAGLLVANALQGWASMPVPYQVDGCVVDGCLFSVSASGNPPRANHIQTQMDLTRHEGQRIQLKGMLSPGDYFEADTNSLKARGPMPANWKPLVDQERAWLFRGQAIQALGNGEAGNALRLINKAIELDGTIAAFYLTRAAIHEKQGELELAAQDALHAANDFGDQCNRYPDLELAADLCIAAGKKEAGLDLLDRAIRECGYPPDREQLDKKRARLAAAELEHSLPGK